MNCIEVACGTAVSYAVTDGGKRSIIFLNYNHRTFSNANYVFVRMAAVFCGWILFGPKKFRIEISLYPLMLLLLCKCGTVAEVNQTRVRLKGQFHEIFCSGFFLNPLILVLLEMS